MTQKINKHDEVLRGWIDNYLRTEMVTIGTNIDNAKTGQMWAFDSDRLSKQIIAKVASHYQALEEHCSELVDDVIRLEAELKDFYCPHPEVGVTVDGCDECPLIEEAKKQERERLGDKLRAWLTSSLSDSEFASEFQVDKYDWNILFNEKQATFNSYCGSLIEECDYPLCKAKQALEQEEE